MDFKECEVFLRAFFGLCFYWCSLTEVVKHPQSYPLMTDMIQKLISQSRSFESKTSRPNHLLRSFEVQPILSSTKCDEDPSDSGVFWRPVYGIDRELEKLFRDVGGRTSHIGFVDGYTNLIIDDKKLRMRSTKVNHSSLSRHKSPKSFGPVGNCINSILTGMSLSCHMNHHGELAKDILTARLVVLGCAMIF